MSYNDHYYEYADVVEAVPEKEAPIDTLNQYVKMVNKEKFVYNKRYVPADELEYNYQKIAITYTNPSASFNVVLVSLYFAFALSILLFTFRVTSGRNWLITLISLGIFNVLLAIITAMRSTGFIYMIGKVVVVYYYEINKQKFYVNHEVKFYIILSNLFQICINKNILRQVTAFDTLDKGVVNL